MSLISSLRLKSKAGKSIFKTNGTHGFGRNRSVDGVSERRMLNRSRDVLVSLYRDTELNTQRHRDKKLH